MATEQELSYAQRTGGLQAIVTGAAISLKVTLDYNDMPDLVRERLQEALDLLNDGLTKYDN